ncbi:MAG: CHASE3 domain-containing protein, partial [Actinomycetota bacterium]|nr:CHASE3 domain-containing protein [Actinomycetota bacterium]
MRRPPVPAAPLTITRRLTAVFALLVLLLLVVGAGGVGSMLLAGGAGEQVARYDHLRDANADALQAMTDAETGVRGYRLSQDRRFLEPYWSGTVRFPQALAVAQAHTDSSAIHEALDRQEATGEAWQRVTGRPVAALPPRRATSTPSEVRAGKRAFDEFRAANEAVAILADTDRARHAERAERLRVTSVLLLLTGLVAAVALAVLVAVRTSRELVGPLAALRDTLRALTAGDREARAPEGSGPSEIRELSAAVNSLAEEAERLHLERAESERLRHVAVEIGRHVRESLDVDDVLFEAVRAVGFGLRCDRAFVRLSGPGGVGPVAVQWRAPGLAPMPTGDQERGGPALAPPREPASAGQRIVCHDAESDPRLQSVEGLHYLLVTDARSFVAVPITAGGELLGTLTIARVATAYRWSEAEVQALEAIAADLGRALVHARLFARQGELVTQLRELDRTKTDFLSTVSHELRTPLTSIAGYIELIRDGDAGPVTADMSRMLDVVDRNTSRLKSLIDDLLTLSRIESGFFRMSSAPVDVAEL